ncbi:efflux RND transporter periplasmic adaptor subunit [Varunaivibrio sulfuroxidans]|uniref:Macrolide-specific efflux system membrane fusion protein n=1 Tax=Varunaivibrio sulfuroxidans TaxID=1773489 RepID=A0A4R3JGW2_9PROT|nr:efflux RND transporter periplasmic adaptor subunit [Varunaivibrio sulfuroxidans]TCS65177.1 macrolide-specific efflux system membrane fusion protein [Varunaivibrio sulfuroxidans]WES29541.1 efflux RND transporter periplasmic adaptor subunit [Varunaivibrio sulfuroxidans]
MHMPSSRSKLFWVLCVIVLAGVVGGGLWIALARTGDGAASKWITTTVVRGDIEDTTTALGTLQPRDYVDVGTQVSGQLRKILVAIGDTVTKGQLLAEIDPTLYSAKVDEDRALLASLRAQLAGKNAQLNLTHEQLTRQKRMLQANATSKESYQSAVAAEKSAAAQVTQINAEIEQTTSQLAGDVAKLGYTRIYAPMAGTVVSLTARQGQTVNASQQAPTLLRIADLDSMTVWTQVSEADVNKLKIGQPVYFTTLGRPDHRWRSTLRQILPTPEILNNVVLYDALFDIPNPDRSLGIAMSAQVFFVHGAAKDTLLVPLAAVTGKGKAAAVRLIENGAVERRAVTVGVRNRVQAEILSGLKVGDEVVVDQRQTGAKSESKPNRGPRL